MIALNPEGLESEVIDQNRFQIRNFEWDFVRIYYMNCERGFVGPFWSTALQGLITLSHRMSYRR